MFGIDWDGDGKEELFDDMVSIEVLKDDINVNNKEAGEKKTDNILGKNNK